MYHAAVKQGKIPRSRALGSQVVSGNDRTPFLWLSVCALLFVAILCVWSRAEVVSLGYEISKESRHLLELRDVNEKLRAEVAMLNAPGRLEPIARDRLNLFHPKSHQIVLVR